MSHSVLMFLDILSRFLGDFICQNPMKPLLFSNNLHHQALLTLCYLKIKLLAGFHHRLRQPINHHLRNPVPTLKILFPYLQENFLLRSSYLFLNLLYNLRILHHQLHRRFITIIEKNNLGLSLLLELNPVFAKLFIKMYYNLI